MTYLVVPRVDAIQKQAKKNEAIHTENKKRCAENVEEAKRRKQVEETAGELYNWIGKINAELLEVK